MQKKRPLKKSPPKKTPLKNRKKVVVSLVLDETGSMMPVRESTISGFNEYIQNLKKDKKTDFRVSLTKFNSNIGTKVVYTDSAASRVPVLDLKGYSPDGMTPLYDAVGETIHSLEKKYKARKEVLVVIITDGEENHSRKFDQKHIFDLVQKKQDEGWKFVFLGANIDVWVVGNALGVRNLKGQTMTYAHNPVGVRSAFNACYSATVSYSSTGDVDLSNIKSSTTKP